MLASVPGPQSPGAATVVKLNTAESMPVPQAFVACTRQKCCVLVFSVTFEVQVGAARPVAEATMLLNPALVATWML